MKVNKPIVPVPGNTGGKKKPSTPKQGNTKLRERMVSIALSLARMCAPCAPHSYFKQQKIGRDPNGVGFTNQGLINYVLLQVLDRFDEKKADSLICRELFDHFSDPQENINISGEPENKVLVESLSLQLKKGWKYSRPKNNQGKAMPE